MEDETTVEETFEGEDITPEGSVSTIYLLPFTPEQENEREAIRLEGKAREDERQAQADARESARAKLTALGLTTEEVVALIG